MFSISDDDVVGSSPSTRKKNVYASDEESASEDEKSDGRFILCQVSLSFLSGFFWGGGGSGRLVTIIKSLHLPNKLHG